MIKLINSYSKFFGSFLFSPLYQRLLTFALAFVVILSSGEMALAQSTNQVTISGTFIVNWGDSRSGTGVEILSISDRAGKTTVLNIDPKVLEAAGGLANLNRKTVTITGKPAVITQVGTDPALRVEAIVVDSKNPENFQKQIISGSKAYINILCRFPDQPDQYPDKYNPPDHSYFNGLMSANYPGMSYYWNEASYGMVNLNGTTTVGPFNLPYDRSHYVNGSADLEALFSDCTKLADPSVDFRNYYGVNMAFNSDLDGYAWGGSWWATLDGLSKPWPSTWEPPWGWTAQTVYAHEMGHSFGLPHSAYNGQTYDNTWDVLSATWTTCSNLSDPLYGCLGQQTIMYHKDYYLGWIPANRKYTYSGSAPAPITLERSDLPGPNGYLMAQIPYGSSGYFYTVEARRKVGFDTKLYSNAVVIHDVHLGRVEPAWVQGTDGGTGSAWSVGQTFTDVTNNIRIRVDADNPSGTGYQITINPRPAAPLGFTASLSGTNKINLNWNDVADEEGYTLERSTDGGNIYSPLATLAANSTSYQDTNLPEGTYYYRLGSYNLIGPSLTKSVSPGVFTPPYAPGGLYARATSATQINLTWNDYSAINDGYVVERSSSPSSGFTTLTTIANGAAISYNDSPVSSGTTYYYRVKATKAAVPDSLYSSVVHATPGNVLVVSVGTGNGADTLFWALNQAALPANSNAIINITVAQVNVSGTLPNVPAGVTISGSCVSGPGVIIQGSGGPGLRFNTGSYSLFGLKIQGFGKPQIGPVLGASPKYTMKCVAINNQ